MHRNPREDHGMGLKTLQNPARRQILKLLSENNMNLGEIGKEMGIEGMQAKLHLDMLEDALYVEKTDSNGEAVYGLTPRGEAYLENVKAGGKND